MPKLYPNSAEGYRLELQSCVSEIAVYDIVTSMATRSGTAARTKLRTPVRRSCRDRHDRSYAA